MLKSFPLAREEHERAADERRVENKNMNFYNAQYHEEIQLKFMLGLWSASLMCVRRVAAIVEKPFRRSAATATTRASLCALRRLMK